MGQLLIAVPTPGRRWTPRVCRRPAVPAAPSDPCGSWATLNVCR